MAATTEYLTFVLDQLSNWRTIHTKRMFGCIGLYVEDLMFGVINEERLYFKVDETNQAQYAHAGSKQLSLFKNNTIVPSLYEVPVDVLEDSEQLVAWAELALEIQQRRNT